MLCALAGGLDAITAQGVPVRRVVLVGGGAQSDAVRRIAPTVFGTPVLVPRPGEYVADGAARQAAWVLAGGPTPPPWHLSTVEHYQADPAPAVRERYAEAREMILDRLADTA
jgi:xylulokinase